MTTALIIALLCIGLPVALALLIAAGVVAEINAAQCREDAEHL